MRDAEPLHILLLGPPEVRWEGKPVKFSRRNQRALLFYLAVEGRVSREGLQELFWPADTYGGRSNANFRVNLTRLRKDLPSDEILQTNKDSIWLRQDLVSIDAVNFLEMVDQPLRVAAKFQSTALFPEPMVAQLRRGAELWRSPGFLQGFSITETNPFLDHWLENAAWRFNDTHWRVLASLAKHFAAAGDLDAAIQWANAALEIDPWQADLHAQVIHWSLALNRTSTALNIISSLQDQYTREGEEIPEELATLFHSVRRQVISTNRNSTSKDWPGRLLVQVPLVGRRAELAALQSAFRRGGAAVIWGETGSGKTRLAYEMHQALQPRPRLLVMNAIQGENRLPYQPLIDVLRRSVSQEEWQNLAPHWRQAIARLLPEVASLSGGETARQNISADLQTGFLYEALSQTLLMISRSQPILIVLDSAQWCDSDSLAALAYLVERHFFEEHGLLLITARKEMHASPLDAFIGQQSKASQFLQVDLPALNQAEVDELALQVLDEHLDPELVNRLVSDTGGIPMFLLETLYALLEYAPATGQNIRIEKLPVGGSIHNFLRERVDQLSLAARQAAEAGAALGTEFSQPLLEKVTLLDQDSIVRALDELQQAGLIQTIPYGSLPGSKFVYGQLQEVIRWGMGPARLRLLHLRAARAIEEQPEQTAQSATMLARHYEAAGEIQTAIRHWVTAAMLARSNFLIEDALDAFGCAERLALRDQHSLPENELNHFYAHWGETASDQQDLDLMEHIYSRMVELGEERQSKLLMGNGLGGLATLYALRKEPQRSMEMFQRAEHHLQQLDKSFALANLYNRQGWYMVTQMRYDEAAALLAKARQMAGEIDVPQMAEHRAVIEYRLGMVYNLVGDSPKAQEISHLSLSHDQSPAQVYGHLVMATAKFYMGEYVASLEHARLGIRQARSMSSVYLTGYFLIYQLRAELALGHIDRVWSRLPDVFELATANQFREILSFIQFIRGDIYHLLGELSGAAEFYRAGLETSTGRWDSMLCRLSLGATLADDGQVEEGLRLVDESLKQARQFDLGIVYLPGLSSRANLLAGAGRFDQALAQLDEYRDHYGERYFAANDYVDRRVRCLVWLQRGDLVEARRQGELAVQYSRRIGNPFWELEAFHLLKRSGSLDAAAQARVRELLVMVDHHTRHPDLRRLAETCVQRTRAAILPG